MRVFVMAYGLGSYSVFLFAFIYMIAFTGGFQLSFPILPVVATSEVSALLINCTLLLFWGVQHTVMARSKFKEAITVAIPQHVERSTYVLLSSVTLLLLMMCWQPLSGVLWQFNTGVLVAVLWSLFFVGWVLVLISTFLTDHFDLFGLRQSWLYFVKRTYTDVNFTERLFYKWIRHPMMLGMLIAFWAVPTMTMTHFVFSTGMSIYIVIGIYFEERGLLKSIGVEYASYQNRTSRIIPKVY